MRFYNRQHTYYCGIDLHVKTMYVCILDGAGQVLVHRNMPSTPTAFLEVVAPYRADLVVAVECMFTWYWLNRAGDVSVSEECGVEGFCERCEFFSHGSPATTGIWRLTIRAEPRRSRVHRRRRLQRDVRPTSGSSSKRMPRPCSRATRDAAMRRKNSG